MFRYFADKNRLNLTSGRELSYTINSLAGGTLAFKREILAEVPWRPLDCHEDVAFCRDCSEVGIPMLATSRFKYVAVRRDNGAHTYQVPISHLLRKCRIFPEEADPYDVVV